MRGDNDVELRWRRLKRELRNDDQSIMIGEEELSIDYIRYAIAVERNLRMLEAGLHTSDDANEIAVLALKKACECYQANWCGFIEVDMDLGLWTVKIGCPAADAEVTEDNLEPYESADILPRWIEAMKEDRPMIVKDAEEIKDTYPDEYALYQRLNVESVIAVPIRPRPFGFLLVRNPKQHLDRPNLLQLLGVVILQQINTMAVDDGRSMTFSPEDIQDSKDVLIHLFGNLEIYTSLGVLTEEKINSPLITALTGYLLTDKKKYHRSIELAQIAYPETVVDKENPSKNLKALIHRLNELFSSISDDRLIPPNVNGYALNKELHITTDLDQFELYWRQAQHEVSIIRKVEYLKKAVALYRGHILSSISDQIWVVSLDAYYRVEYHKVVNELLKTLFYVEDYHDVVKCATESLMISQDNKEAYYWLVLALEELSLQDMLWEQLQNVKRIFPKDEYEEFMEKFQTERNKRNHRTADKENVFSRFHMGTGRNDKRNTQRNTGLQQKHRH